MKTTVTMFLLCVTAACYGRNMKALADSIRKTHRIPELCYAVVSADSVYEMEALGIRKAGTNLEASLSDRFRIGSNTKAITGYIAALLVKQGKIKWDTKFFDLFPELMQASRREYHDLTLLQLLSMRTKLFSYTYTYPKPVKEQFTGSDSEQRYQFAKWFLNEKPVKNNDIINFSNLGYVAAGLMLEKVSGKPYRQLVADVGKPLNINFQFGPPNMDDPLQTWGHNDQLLPEAPHDNYKLNWLLAAGNINATLPEYVKFIQSQLRGFQGRSPLLTREEFEFLYYGLPHFAVGWFWDTNAQKQRYASNTGNPGTFLTKVFVFDKQDKAFIVFANVQSDTAEEGIDILLGALKEKYSVY